MFRVCCISVQFQCQFETKFSVNFIEMSRIHPNQPHHRPNNLILTEDSSLLISEVKRLNATMMDDSPQFEDSSLHCHTQQITKPVNSGNTFIVPVCTNICCRSAVLNHLDCFHPGGKKCLIYLLVASISQCESQWLYASTAGGKGS